MSLVPFHSTKSCRIDTKLDLMTNNNNIPSPPYSYLSSQRDFLDLSSLDNSIAENETVRQEAFNLGAKIKAALIHCRSVLEQNAAQEEIHDLNNRLDQLVQEALLKDKEQNVSQKSRLANLSFIFGDYARYKAYVHFLETGNLVKQSSLSDMLTDEEYLSGIITFNHDLARYAIGRATERDVGSVLLARDLVSKVLDYLMEYDFRNGNLRRKYDGVKYALKTCETVLYELSVTGCDVPTNPEIRDAKRARITTDKMPQEELDELRKRMVRRDDMREALIKMCRDGQKAAKQAIYALHREDVRGAEKFIQDCERCVLAQLIPIVEKEPQLRYGSFANVLEEYVEAKMFYAWLVVKDGDSVDLSRPKGKVLTPDEMTIIALEPEDYIGGLCDLTGEIGRFAVKKGTERDADGVKLCLETNTSILYAIESLSKLPGGGIGKKMEPLRRSVEKLEKMLYELSLVKATGRNIVAGIEDMEPSND